MSQCLVTDDKPTSFTQAVANLGRRLDHLGKRLRHPTGASPPDAHSEGPARARRPRTSVRKRLASRQRRSVRSLFGVRATQQGLLFVYPSMNARRICVAGDFNRWDPAAHPLTFDPRLGVWQGCIPAEPGSYRYRLVVDGRWIQDRFKRYVECNPFGELNNVVDLLPDQNHQHAEIRAAALTGREGP